MKKYIFVIFLTTLISAQVKEGDRAPNFFLKTLQGDSFYLSRTVGAKARPNARTPIIVSFFQTTCIPCKAEIKEFEKLAEDIPEVPIYLIALNESPALVKEYLAQYPIKLNMLMDRYGVTGKKYGVVDAGGLAHLPNSFIIAADGTIRYHHRGFKPGDEVKYREVMTQLAQEVAMEKAALAAANAEAAAETTATAKSTAGGNGGNSVEVGSKAPTFSLPKLNGDRFYLSRVVGDKAKPGAKMPIVVSFFQTTCIPCKAEISELEKLQEEFPGVKIYLLDLNEKKELVQEYVDRFDIKIEMILDRYGTVGKKYGVVDARNMALLPNSFVIDSDGKIYYHHTGFKPGDEEHYRQKFIELTK